MSAPTKTAARKRTAAKRTAPASTGPSNGPAPDPGAVPVLPAKPTAEERIQQLTGIEMEEALQILQTRVGEMETQRLMDGRIIQRLVTRILELDPDDPVAAQAVAQKEGK